MSLVINHNMMAANVARNLNTHYGKLAQSTQRLSTGLRVNSAADDAAGLAIRELQRADIAALQQGARNANDAISLIQTADGALAIIDEKLIRMKELAEQAATGTYDSTQRLMIDSEFQAMAAEIDRIANATDFNGIHLLNGNLSGAHNGSGLNSTGAMKIHFGSGNDSAEDYYYVEIQSARISSLFNINPTKVKEVYGYNTHGNNNIKDVNIELNSSILDYNHPLRFDAAYKISPPTVISDSEYIISTPKDAINKYCWIEVGSPGVINHDFSGYEVSYDSLSNTWNIINGDPLYPDATISMLGDGCAINLDNSGGTDVYIHFQNFDNSDTTVSFDIFSDWGIVNNKSGFDSINIKSIEPNGNNRRFQIELNNSGQADVIGEILTDGDGSTFNAVVSFDGDDFSIETQDLSQKMLQRVNDAIVIKDKIRANLGALQNRLENTITNITTQAETLQAAESRISDVDVATEMTEFVRQQILAQSAVAMLSQANAMPQMAMQLIGG